MKLDVLPPKEAFPLCEDVTRLYLDADDLFFRYVPSMDFTEQQVTAFNAPSCLSDRLALAEEWGVKFLPTGACNKVFQNNLIYIDTRMDEILSAALLLYYSRGEKTFLVSEVIACVKALNPCGWDMHCGVDFYEYKVQKLLLAAALGMNPKIPWDGHYEQERVLALRKYAGDARCISLFSFNECENYLFYHTRFDSCLSSDWGCLKKDENGWCLDLMFQIRLC